MGYPRLLWTVTRRARRVNLPGWGRFQDSPFFVSRIRDFLSFRDVRFFNIGPRDSEHSLLFGFSSDNLRFSNSWAPRIFLFSSKIPRFDTPISPSLYLSKFKTEHGLLKSTLINFQVGTALLKIFILSYRYEKYKKF